MTKNNNKQYFFRIYHEKIGYGGHKEKLFKNFDYLLCDTKKKAFERAKYELFNLAKIDYEHLFCIKEEFEDFYLELLKNDNYEELDNLLNNLDVFDFNKLAEHESNLTEPAITLGDLSYCYDTTYYKIRVFSKKVKNFSKK